MAKIKKAPKTKKVEFIKPFDGSLNYFYIKVTRQELEDGKVEKELPPAVYDWIQKFKVCK